MSFRERMLKWLTRNQLILKLIGGVYFGVGVGWAFEALVGVSLVSGLALAVIGIVLLVVSGEVDLIDDDDQEAETP